MWHHHHHHHHFIIWNIYGQTQGPRARGRKVAIFTRKKKEKLESNLVKKRKRNTNCLELRRSTFVIGEFYIPYNSCNECFNYIVRISLSSTRKVVYRHIYKFINYFTLQFFHRYILYICSIKIIVEEYKTSAQPFKWCIIVIIYQTGANPKLKHRIIQEL